MPATPVQITHPCLDSIQHPSRGVPSCLLAKHDFPRRYKAARIAQGVLQAPRILLTLALTLIFSDSIGLAYHIRGEVVPAFALMRPDPRPNEILEDVSMLKYIVMTWPNTPTPTCVRGLTQPALNPSLLKLPHPR